MITLLNGRQVSENDLVFNQSNYHFTLRSSGADVTNLIRRSDKLALVPGFDETKENFRLSTERPASGGGTMATEEDLRELNESTAGIFVEQMTSDPLSAPLETLDSAVEQVFSSSGVKTLLVLGIVAVVAVIAIKKG